MLIIFLLAVTLANAATYQVTPDIEFAAPGGESLKLDAHIPEGKGPFPAVILVHGGGWTAGHKTVNFVHALFPVLDQTGMAWFTIDYRLAPKHPYPAARLDVESAVRWVKKNAKTYKVNPNKIALMGESAGGHLVNLVGAKNDVGVAAVVSFYGPIDMVQFAKSRAVVTGSSARSLQRTVHSGPPSGMAAGRRARIGPDRDQSINGCLITITTACATT